MKFSKYKSGDNEANSRWFHHCTNKNIPFVTVDYRTKLADIEFDYITFSSKEYDEALRAKEAETREVTFDIFERYKNSRSTVVSAGWGVIKLKDIEIEYADNVAEELYDYISGVISSEIA